MGLLSLVLGSLAHFRRRVAAAESARLDGNTRLRGALAVQGRDETGVLRITDLDKSILIITAKKAPPKWLECSTVL